MASKEWILSSKWLKFLAKIVITCLLFYFAIHKIDVKVLGSLFNNSNILYLFAAVLSYLMSIIVGASRSLTILNSINVNLDYWTNIKLYFIGLFYNLALPGAIAGDAYRIFVLRKQFEISTKKLFFAVLFDRLSGLWAICFLTFVCLLWAPIFELNRFWLSIIFLTCTATYVVFVRYLYPDYHKRIAFVHLLAIIGQALQGICVICILESQNFSADFSPYLLSFWIALLATYIPISIGGLGIREYVMAHLASYFNIDLTLSVYVSISFFVISTLVASSGMWIHKPFKLDFNRNKH